jgi:hypothetical protein
VFGKRFGKMEHRESLVVRDSPNQRSLGRVRSRIEDAVPSSQVDVDSIQWLA